MKLSFESRLLLFVLDELNPNEFYLERKSLEKHLYKLHNIMPAHFPFKFEDKLVTYFYVNVNLGRLRLNFHNNKSNDRVIELFKNDIIDGSIINNQGRDVNLNLDPKFNWFDRVPVKGLEQIDQDVMSYVRIKLI